MGALTCLFTLLLGAASAEEAWRPYRLRGTPFSLSVPPGAEIRRGGEPGAAQDGRFALRETYGEKADRDGIVIPLRHGFLSATYYRKPAVYGSINDYLEANRKKKPWGKTSRGTWEGMPTLTAGWEEKALNGVPTISVHYVVEERRWSVLVLELYTDAEHLDEATPLLVKLKDSLRLASKSSRGP